MLLSIAASAQDAEQKQRLKAEAENFISLYNTGDSTTYRNFLASVIQDKPLLENTLIRYGNTYRTVGEVDIKDLVYKSPTDVEVIVQEKKFDSWWRFHLTTDENQKFLKRTVMPIPMPEIGLKNKKATKEEFISSLDDFVANKLGSNFNGNVFVYDKGKQVYGKSFGSNPAGEKNTENTQFGLASGSKMFTAILIFQLLEEGKLQLKDPVKKFLPELKNAALHEITIEQLLTHTSGMGDFFENPEFGEMESLTTSKSYLPFIEADVPAFPPGEGFRYSNTGYSLLGVIIEKISGTSFQQLVKSQILDPLNMERTLAGTSAGGGFSTSDDMHKFLSGLRQGKLLSKENTQLLMTHTIDGKYGYGTEHHILGSEHIVGHSGGYINQCVELNIYPESDYIVVILSNSNPPFGHFLSNKVKELLLYK